MPVASAASRLVRVVTAVTVLIACVLFVGCGSKNDQDCCSGPVLEETDVHFTWTVNGLSPAQACAAAGARTVRLEVKVSSGEPAVADVPCTDGTAKVRATVFAPALGTMSAGVAFARLLDEAGAEVSALRKALTWSAQPAAGGSVAAAAALVTTPPAGSLRYRWCEPVGTDGARHVIADGPMWRLQIVNAGATEAVFPDIAPGTYTFWDGEPAEVQLMVGRDAVVVAGRETVLSVYPCPL
jgi:hypothetical protein